MKDNALFMYPELLSSNKKVIKRRLVLKVTKPENNESRYITAGCVNQLRMKTLHEKKKLILALAPCL